MSNRNIPERLRFRVGENDGKRCRGQIQEGLTECQTLTSHSMGFCLEMLLDLCLASSENMKQDTYSPRKDQN